MESDNKIATMSIQDVVNLPGGNRLSSPAFQAPLNFLWAFGWQNVEQGVEALICNGQVFEKTKLKSDFRRLIGKRSFFRRVLLRPAPLTVKAESLSQDELRVSLEISIKYEVIDPTYVASVQNPISELINLLEGLIAECIRSFPSEALIGDNNSPKKWLFNQIQKSLLFEDKYKFFDLLKFIPTSDESLIEIKRNTRAANLQKDLEEALGKNKLVIAEYELSIAREEAKLELEKRQNEHEHELDILEIKTKGEIINTAINAVGTVASSGINPTPIVSEVIEKLPDRFSNQFHSRKSIESPDFSIKKIGSTFTQVEKERKALESIKSKIGITTYELLSSEQNVNGAVIKMSSYEIIFTCGENYPDDKPDVIVRFVNGETAIPEDFWMDGVSNLIAQAVMVIVNQIITD